MDVEKFYLCWQKYPQRNRSIGSQQPALAVCISFSSIPFGTARLSKAHSAGGCASSDMDEDAPGRNGNAVVSSTFFSDHNACWLWNGGLSLLLYTRTGQALMCIQSKLFFLGMPAAMQSKRKGKQALKWALKPSLWCSENKSLFAAKKKINWQRYSLFFHCIPCLHSHLYSVMFLHKLTPAKTRQHMSSGAITWLAWESSLLLSSPNSPWSPAFQHGGGYGMETARPPCIPLLGWGVRPGANQASSTTTTQLRVPLPEGGCWSQRCCGLARQLWPGISHHSAFAFLPSLILQAPQVRGSFLLLGNVQHYIK